MTSFTRSNNEILFVEDDTDIAAILCDVLIDEGYSVLHARDGQAALELLSDNGKHVGLILLDVLMPRMNGLAFRQQQLRDRNIAHIPVVIVTTGAAVDGEVKPAAFLRKPFSTDDLLSVVERFVGAAPA